MSSRDESVEWVSAHVFHAGDLDRLLIDAVVPLAGRLHGAGLVRRWFFLRYWAGGPHLRVRLLARGRDVPVVESTVATGLRRYLARHRSDRTVSAARYRDVAARLAAAEGHAGVPELVPNDTVRFEPYQPERERYGFGRAMDVVERHFAESSALAARIVDAEPGMDRRGTLGLAAIFLAHAVAAADPADLARRSTTSERRWRETLDPDGPSASAAYQRMRTPIGSTLARLRVLLDHDTPTGPDGHWLTALRRLSTGLRAAGNHEPGPVLDACAHLHCNRVGLPGPAEAHVRSLLAHAVTDTARVGGRR